MTDPVTTAVDTAFHEIMNEYPLSLDSETETHNMWRKMKSIVVKHVSAVATKPKATRKKKTADANASASEKTANPNYYAHFHGCCSLKAPRDAGPLASGQVFTYHDDITSMASNRDPKSKAKQEANIALVANDSDTTISFGQFKGKTLTEVATFLEKHPNKAIRDMKAMSRTSMIWWLFLSEEHRNAFQKWYKEKTGTGTATATTAATATATASVVVAPKTPKAPAKAPASKPVPKVAAAHVEPLVDEAEDATEDVAEAEAVAEDEGVVEDEDEAEDEAEEPELETEPVPVPVLPKTVSKASSHVTRTLVTKKN